MMEKPEEELPRKATAIREGQLRKSLKIREQVKLALTEQPNAMVKYRLEMVLALAQDLVNEAQSASGGTATHKPDKGPKEAGV